MLFDFASLTDTKRRLISKRGLKFRDPLAAYDTVRTDLANNKQRYQTKVGETRLRFKPDISVALVLPRPLFKFTISRPVPPGCPFVYCLCLSSSSF